MLLFFMSSTPLKLPHIYFIRHNLNFGWAISLGKKHIGISMILLNANKHTKCHQSVSYILFHPLLSGKLWLYITYHFDKGRWALYFTQCCYIAFSVVLYQSTTVYFSNDAHVYTQQQFNTVLELLLFSSIIHILLRTDIVTFWYDVPCLWLTSLTWLMAIINLFLFTRMVFNWSSHLFIFHVIISCYSSSSLWNSSLIIISLRKVCFKKMT